MADIEWQSATLGDNLESTATLASRFAHSRPPGALALPARPPPAPVTFTSLHSIAGCELPSPDALPALLLSSLARRDSSPEAAVSGVSGGDTSSESVSTLRRHGLATGMKPDTNDARGVNDDRGSARPAATALPCGAHATVPAWRGVAPLGGSLAPASGAVVSPATPEAASAPPSSRGSSADAVAGTVCGSSRASCASVPVACKACTAVGAANS